MAQTKWFVAQDTFSVGLDSGASRTVTKGETFPEGHEIVLKDAGRGLLFKLQGEPEPEPEAPKAKPAPRKGA